MMVVRRLAVLVLLINCSVLCSVAADSKRTTTELVTCPAAATVSADDLELWKRVRTSLGEEPALTPSDVLVLSLIHI